MKLTLIIAIFKSKLTPIIAIYTKKVVLTLAKRWYNHCRLLRKSHETTRT